MKGLRERETQLFELRRLFKPGHHVLALVDSTVERPEWMEEVDPKHCHVLPVPGYESAPQRRPTLVELRDCEDRILAASFDTALAQARDPDQPLRQIGGWLLAGALPAHLASVLGRWMTLRSPQGPRFARLHDPRVLWLMSALFDGESMNVPPEALLQWLVLDWHGALWSLPRHHLEPAADSGGRLHSTFVRKLARVELLNHALRALHCQGIRVDASLARDLELRLSRRETSAPREAGGTRLHALLSEWLDNPRAAVPSPHEARMPG